MPNSNRSFTLASKATRRIFGTALVALFSYISLALGKLRAQTISNSGKEERSPQVLTGTTRQDAIALPALKFLRAEQFKSGGPAVDILYQLTGFQEPIEDITRIQLANGQWARQVFPTGILNALAFGATGDGESDDTLALQNFIDTVLLNGSRGFIPAGRYRITQPLRIGQDPRKPERQRGFTLEGASRTGLSGARPRDGTLILLDSPHATEAVLIWEGSAWRDARLTSLGFACKTADLAAYGVLVRSSEISQIEFDHLHIENATIAFGLLQGTGFNGEFCTWSNIQTWNVRDFFYSNAGQAYGLRFRDSFCYYRPGGTLFTFETEIVGGGLHLNSFDATPVRSNELSERIDTRLFLLAGNHNAPITVIGGRFEHITVIAEIITTSLNIIVHNQLQFIGCDFTTNLDQIKATNDKATFRFRHQAVVDLNFLNCSFASALPESDDEVLLVHVDDNCRGNVRFVQCGYWGYSKKPYYLGPNDIAFQVSWKDCLANDFQSSVQGYAKRAYGERFNRFINDH